MSDLITKLNPALVAEAMQAPAVIYKSNSKVNLSSGDCKSHIYTSDTGIGVIILNDSTIPSSMFEQSDCSSVQLVNITEIEDTAFRGCSSLTSVAIGNGVTKIGSWAFNGCSNLTSVTIPDSVTEIGVRAFSGCTSLASITIPDSVTEIGESAFSECGLTSVTISKHVTYIADGAFNTCSQLSTIYCRASTPPDTVEDAGCLPYNSNLKIYIPINSLELYQNHEYWQHRVGTLIETVFEDEVLESGTNIKTINGNSILGSGDITISGGSSSSAYSEVSHGTADTTFELTPNTFHVWDEMTELDLSLGAETAGVANEYLFQFTSGSTATSLTLPDDIKWANDGVPVIEANKIYQISILKGLGNVMNWDVPIIDFTINSQEYQAEQGMTFYDWALSKYYDSSCQLTLLGYGSTTDLKENIIAENISSDDSISIFYGGGIPLIPSISTDTIIQPISYIVYSDSYEDQ